MRIVFHGHVAASYLEGFAELLESPHEINAVPDRLESRSQERLYGSAAVLVSNFLDRSLRLSSGLLLFQTPSSGMDLIDAALLPKRVPLCNCQGHEAAIAEYVLAALLLRHVPLVKADAALRRGEWPFHSGTPVRTELGETTIGLLGYGGISRAIAARAKAFGVRIHVANRSIVEPGVHVDRYYTLEELAAFMGSADAIVAALPSTPETAGLIDAAALGAMRSDAVIVNVGRGPVIDEQALYEALSQGRIGGAVIDTWYSYPAPGEETRMPSRFPFHTLKNLVMTPHISGWTTATRRRRQQTMAGNINRLARGEPLENVVLRI